MQSFPSVFDASRTWEYAEHRVLEDQPRLQWTANGLETIELDFHFHSSFTDPSTQAAALVIAAGDHNARPLVFGNGVHRGYFIVTSIRTTAEQMSSNGDVIAMTVRVALKEYALASILGTDGPSVSFPLLGIASTLGDTSGSTSTISGKLGTGFAETASASPVPALVTSAPGVSPILTVSRLTGSTKAHLSLGDIPTSVIVRASV